MNSENRCMLFQNELKLILDKKIRQFTKQCLLEAPDYFFDDCPSSSTGKYHPADELEGDGTIIHTKRVFRIANELHKGYDCKKFKSEILSACILHDILKRGLNKTRHNTTLHPSLAADLVNEIQEKTNLLSEESHKIIRNCVGYHMGPWSKGSWKKDIKKYTIEEFIVYTADYISSRRWINVEIN